MEIIWTKPSLKRNTFHIDGRISGGDGTVSAFNWIRIETGVERLTVGNGLTEHEAVYQALLGANTSPRAAGQRSLRIRTNYSATSRVDSRLETGDWPNSLRKRGNSFEKRNSRSMSATFFVKTIKRYRPPDWHSSKESGGYEGRCDGHGTSKCRRSAEETILLD